MRARWIPALLLALLAGDAPPAVGGKLEVYAARQIITMDPDLPTATAVAVRDGRIVDLGSISSVTSVAGAGIKIDHTFADLVLVPGFIDNHLHPGLAAALLPGDFVTPYDWSLPDREVKGVQGRAAYLARLAELEAAKGRSDAWLVAWGYHPQFHGALSRADLDAVSAQRPILVWHRSFHEIYLNSAALAAWGVTAEAVAGKPGVEWERGRFYETGLAALQEPLAALVLDPDRYRAGLLATRRLVHRGGLTTIADPGIPIFDLERESALIRQVYDNRETPFRTLLIPNGMTLGRRLGNRDALDLMKTLPGRRKGRVRFLRQVKLFADGAFYSQLMQMSEGYLDGHQGEWLMTPKQLRSAARVYWKAGWPIHVHVNGDLGVDVVLDVLQELREENRRRRRRPRFVLHHMGYFTEAQAARIRRLGALVSANPYYVHALGDAYAEVGLGPERAHRISAMGSLARRKVPLSFHSDLPMAPAEPLTLAWVAVNRISAKGQVLEPTERISIHTALRAVTIEAARALGMEKEIGSITPGKRADFTVLEQSPYEVEPEALKDVPIWGTVYEGRVYPLRR